MSNLMPKAGKSKRRKSERSPRDMQEISLGQTAAGEGYLRLRMRYDRGDLSIVGVKQVPGPLASSERLEEGYIYEITRGARRIHVEAIPDLGVERSFPPPEGMETRDLRGHHITELETYEFNVRIPQDEVSRRSLRSLQITLYQTAEIPETRSIEAGPLKKQFKQDLREIGNLKGIELDKLPDNVRQQMDRYLP